jgi:predicted metal-dependent phosphoesterase TrpH
LCRVAGSMFAFDPHVHSWYSADAADSPEDLIAAARVRALDGIVITDHDTCAAHAYCLEAGLARPDGLPVDGFLVVPGVEVSSSDGHLLCLGAVLPDMAGQPASEVCAAIRAAGGEPVPAHPFDRWRSGIPPEVLETLDLRVIETFNAAVSSKSFNQRAAAYAVSRGLGGVAGSDAHHASAVGVSRTRCDPAELSVRALVDALRTNPKPLGRYLSRREALKKHFANFFRKKNAPQ